MTQNNSIDVTTIGNAIVDIIAQCNDNFLEEFKIIKASMDLIDEQSKYLFNQNANESVEISLEANPGSIFKNKLKNFSDAGINRISIGVQSFDRENLHFLGRDHSVYDAKRALELSRNIFNNLSFFAIRKSTSSSRANPYPITTSPIG